MSKITQITIAGFSGRIAQLIASYLSREDQRIAANTRANPNINIFETDSSDKIALTEAVKGSQVCICCYLGDNTLMTEGQKVLIDVAIAAGVSRYIASDWSADYRTVALGEVPMKDPMKIVCVYLQQKQSQGNAIQGVHILNGGFTEVILQNIFADEAHTKIQYFGSGDEGLDVSTMPNAAAWTAEAAMDPTATGVINVRGDRVSAKDIAKLLEEAYGTKIALQNAGSLEDLQNIVGGMREREPDNLYAWMALLYLQWMLSGKADLTSVDNARFPMAQPVTIEDFLKQRTLEDVTKGYKR